MQEIGPQTFEQFMQEPVDMVEALQQTANEIGARENAVQRTLRAMILGGVVDTYPEHGVDGLTMSRQTVQDLLRVWEEDPLRRPRNIGEKSMLLLGVFCHDETSLTTLADQRAEEARAAEVERLRIKRLSAFDSVRVGNKVLGIVTPASMRSLMRRERPADQDLLFQGIVSAVAKNLHPQQPPLQRVAGSLAYPSGVVFTDTYTAGARMVRSLSILPQRFEPGYVSVMESGQKVPGFTPRAQEATEHYIQSIQELLRQES